MDDRKKYISLKFTVQTLMLNPAKYGQVVSWIPSFRTRIFGRIHDDKLAGALGGDAASAFDSLHVGIQFSLRENGKWLRFWLPSP